MDLEFFVSHKGNLAVIALRGSLAEDRSATLERCLKQVLEEQPRGVVVHLAEVSAFQKEGQRAFAKFLRDIKVSNAVIRISSLEGKWRDGLVKDGILSPPEVIDTLQEAIRALAVQVKAAA